MITTVNTLMPGAVQIPPIDGKKFTAALPIPSNLNVGVAYQTSEKLLLSAEIQYVGWKAYDKLTIGYGSDAGNLQLVSNKNFKNSMIYRFGVIYDMTPVDKMLYSPETPGANKLSFTTGISYKPIDMLTIDLGFQALVGEKVRGYVPETWNPTVNFVGDYKATALIPALGFKFNF